MSFIFYIGVALVALFLWYENSIITPTDLSRIAARSGGVFPESSTAMLIDGRFDLPAHGSREMPIWGTRLADQIPGMATGEVARGQITSLVEYLKSLQVE